MIWFILLAPSTPETSGGEGMFQTCQCVRPGSDKVGPGPGGAQPTCGAHPTHVVPPATEPPKILDMREREYA